MRILRLAWLSLLHSKGKTAILVVALGVSAALPVAVYQFLRRFEENLISRSSSTPLVVGAKGSRFDLVLHALYGRGRVPEAVAGREASRIQDSKLGLAIPVHARFTARGYPLMGTTLEYFSRRRLAPEVGTLPVFLGDCVVGANVAYALDLTPGDKLLSDPENVFDLAGQVPLRMRVTGVLEKTGTPDDDMVFTDLRSAWIIEGIGHGHNDEDPRSGSNLVLDRTDENVVYNAALPQYLEVTEENRDRFHFHGDRDGFPVTAVLVFPFDAKSGVLLRGRYVDPDLSVQILDPRSVIEDLLGQVFRVRRLFDLHVSLVGGTTALLLALIVLLTVKLRRRERETMAKLGCSRSVIFSLHFTEILITLGFSAIFGLGLAKGALALAPLFVGSLATAASDSATPESRRPELQPGQPRPRVEALNYPLAYFAQRMGGDRFDVGLRVPAGEDPAFWVPGPADVLELQSADLVLLNGAGHEPWVDGVVLPWSKTVVTSNGFRDTLLTVPSVSHSHGPDGDSSHRGADFNTWLDPTQARAQAELVYRGLCNVDPAHRATYEEKWRTLERDLEDLDKGLRSLDSRGSGPIVLVASHPVYDYLARRYGWSLRSVHWEPDVDPTEPEWEDLREVLKDHRAGLMLWESAPPARVRERLEREHGIEVVIFDPCGQRPENGDYLEVMRGNLSRLRLALQE